MKKYAKAGVDIKRDGEAVKSLLAGMKQKELPGVFAKYHYVARKTIGISADGVGSKLLCYQKLGNVSNAEKTAGYFLICPTFYTALIGILF